MSSLLPQDQKGVTQWILEQENEFRFEVGVDQSVSIEVVSGTAELFGCELMQGCAYPFSNCKSALFTWTGCTLKCKGPLNHVYVAKDKPACMIVHANVHAALEVQRKDKTKPTGPRVLLVGGADSGKTALSQVLLNYAVRSGWSPHFVDLDVSQNTITLPGSIGAVQVHHPLAIQGCPWHFSPIISYLYGHTVPNAVPDIYKKSIALLAAALHARINNDKRSNQSGFIVNTCGLPTDSFSHDLVIHIAEVFAINVLLVIGSDRLETSLREEKKLAHISIVRVPKSGGVVERDLLFRQKMRQLAIRKYFYGHQNEFHPHVLEIPFANVSMYKVPNGMRSNSGMMPIGQKTKDKNELEKVVPDNSALHCVLGVSFAKEPRSLLQSNVAGYVVVQSVDVQKKVIKLLSLSPGHLPSPYLLMGSIKCMDL